MTARRKKVDCRKQQYCTRRGPFSSTVPLRRPSRRLHTLCEHAVAGPHAARLSDRTKWRIAAAV